MSGKRLFSFLIVLNLVALRPAAAGDSLSPVHPFTGMKRVPLTVHLDLYTGGVAGVATAYETAPRVTFGSRLNLGLLERMDLGINYIYTSQPRAVVVPWRSEADMLLRSNTMDVFFGSRDLIFLRSTKAAVYVSPGLGLVRVADRKRDWFPFGGGDPLPPANTSTASVGVGLRVFQSSPVGVRFELRDHISGSGRWDYPFMVPAVYPPPPAPSPIRNVPRYNSVMFTAGLTFKLR